MSLSWKYPRNWKKVSRTIRRIAGYHCEWCHAQEGAVLPDGRAVHLSVHHVGAPYADGRPGNPHDKRDLRRENLVALCQACHFRADLPSLKAHLRRERRRRRFALVPYQPIASAVISNRTAYEPSAI